MKRNFLAGLLAVLFLNISYGQNSPEFSLPDTAYVFLETGTNQIILPDVSDGDLNTQDITFSVSPLSTDKVNIESVSYTAGEKHAVLTLTEKGVLGQETLSITAEDVDGQVQKDLTIHFINYKKYGLNFEIHDVTFWKQAIPLNGEPTFDTIIQTGEAPYDQLNWDNIELEVSNECGGDLCSGHDFFTSLFKGYLVPETSGEYTFYVRSNDRAGFWLSTDQSFSNAQKLIHDSQDDGMVAGEIVSDKEYKSAPVNLTAGKVYAFYATHWTIHTLLGGVLWEGPDIAKEYIPGENMLTTYDKVLPDAPTKLKANLTTTDEIFISWDEAYDNAGISHYEVFLNGSIVSSPNDTTHRVKNLSPDTDYTIAVRSVDFMGNYSELSNVINVKTYQVESLKPTPPTSYKTEKTTGTAASLTWSGASDGETMVIGYNLYVDGVKYNTEEYLYVDSVVVYDLEPQTTYDVTIEAIDAAYNISDLSEVFSFTTSEFDPLGDDLGEKTARFTLELENISWNNGIGINASYKTGEMLNNPDVKNVIDTLYPGAIRWGAITANSISFADATGAEEPNTYARMLNYANELDAYFALTVGVQDGIDYRTNIQTFDHLLEYLAGPATSTWGAVRADEGYTEPLLQDSKGLILEFGNEVWGSDHHNAGIGDDYQAYGEWCREAAEVIKNSPYYDPDKIKMVYSGRNPHPDDSYGLNETVLTGDEGDVSVLGVSGYLGGNMDYDPDIPQGETELQYYKHRIAQSLKNIEGFVYYMKKGMELTGSIKQFYLYESNSTTPTYRGRLGQAIVMTDYFANAMHYGNIVPTIFHLTGGEWRITDPSDNYAPLPFYTTAQLFNKHCKGHVLSSHIESKHILKDGSGKAISGKPVGAYAFNKGNDYNILLMSRDFENDFTVEINLPSDMNANAEAKMYIVSGNSFNDKQAVIDSSTISISNKFLVKVPKYSMVLISVAGDNQNFNKLPLGYFKHQMPQDIEVLPVDDEHITENGQRIYYDAQVKPDGLFFNQYSWKVIENQYNNQTYVLSRTSQMMLKGSGSCDGNGQITIRAYSMLDTTIYADKVINVSNQGENCETPVSSVESESISVYPNPSADKISIESDDEIHSVTIYNMEGEELIKKDNEFNDLNINNLKPGVYIINIETSNAVIIDKLIKK